MGAAKLKNMLSAFVLCAALASCKSFLDRFDDALGKGFQGTSGQAVTQANLMSEREPYVPEPLWDTAALDTAKNADYLSTVEKAVMYEMNKARTNPALYAELYIRPRLDNFDGKTYAPPGEVAMLTSEGKAAVKECIKEMDAASAAQALVPEKGLWQAAKAHTDDQAQSGKTGHKGSDGSSPFDRIKRSGSYSSAAENISYGEAKARDIVVQFLIDDGVESRGHRKNLLNPKYQAAGVSAQAHPSKRYACVIDFAAGYQEK
jgi:uncharacterized protein YkwD